MPGQSVILHINDILILCMLPYVIDSVLGGGRWRSTRKTCQSSVLRACSTNTLQHIISLFGTIMRIVSPACTHVSHSITGSVQGLGDGHIDPEAFTCRWWELWKAYSGVLEEDDRLTCQPDGPKKEAPNPGLITNTELLNIKDDHNSLKHQADEGSGYRVLSQGSWDFLSKLYGKGSQIYYKAQLPQSRASLQ